MHIMNNVIYKIVDYLICYSHNQQDIGLFHGKMGVVLALASYAKYHKDDFVKNFTWELYEEVFHNIKSEMSLGIENGLSGIAYGTTLLKQIGFVDCDLNYVLQEVDSKIMEYDPRRITDISFHRGLSGVLSYILIRERNGEIISTFDNQYIIELKEQWRLMTGKSSLLSLNIFDFINEPEFKINDYIDQPIGIDRGVSYFLLHQNFSIT